MGNTVNRLKARSGGELRRSFFSSSEHSNTLSGRIAALEMAMAHTEEDGKSAEVSQLTRAASAGSSQTSEEQGQQAVERSAFRRLCSSPEPRGATSRGSPSSDVDVSPSQMLAALRSAVVHESTGWHQGRVEAPTSGPSLLPPAPGIKPYTKGARVMGSESDWLDDVGVGYPVARTSCDVLETEWRDDAGIAAPMPVTNSMHDAPQAPAAKSIPAKKGVVDPLDEWAEIVDVTRCCGKPVTSALGLACLAAAGSMLFCLDGA